MTASAQALPLLVGRCPNCGHPIAVEGTNVKAVCTGCGAPVTLKRIQGVYSATTPCDDRCQYAVTPDCTCACGGANHSRGYIRPVAQRPEWVVDRDEKRHEKRLAAKPKRRTRADQRREQLLESFPTLAYIGQLPNTEFGRKMQQAWATGKMTDRQAAAACGAIRDQLAKTAVAPSGHHRFEATVTKVAPKASPDGSGATWKITVQHDRGWRAWMTCPRALIEAAHRGAGSGEWDRWLLGRRIEVDTELTPAKGSDRAFAFGRYPSAHLTGN